MKPVFIAMLSLILGAGLIHAQGKSSLKTQKDKISYIIGLRYGSGLKRQDIEIDYKSFEKGIRDGLKGGRKLLTKAEIQTVAEQFQRDMRNKAVSKNQREAKAFLAKNRRRKGVRKTASGLQYQVIRRGTGKSPKATDKVRTHYRGTLLDGKVFDSSYRRKRPASFPVNGVIRGWTEALQLMKVGAKWKLWIPAKLGDGQRGTGRMIGPGAMLIFELELLAIE